MVYNGKEDVFMKKAAKITAALAMMGLLAFAAAGCGGDDSAKSGAATGDTLKFGVTNFADSLEPTDNYFGWVVMRYGLGECLVKFDDKMNAVPWLAESWSVSDDKLTWTFKINDKAVFSNGNKVTGEAVKKSIERTFEKAARAYAMFEPASITADGQNVMIKTQTPVATLPGMLGDPLFIIVDTSVTDRDYASQGPICTGPYVVKEYSKAKAVMDANPNYWDGEVPYKHVEIPTIDDPNTRAMALQSGEIDMAVNIAPGDLQLFEDKDRFNISTIASLRDVPDLDALAHERFLKRERAADQEADIALFPVVAHIGQLLAIPLAIAVDAILGNVGADVAAFAYVVRLGRTPDDLKDRAGEGVALGKVLKISRVFRRKDDKVGLCVAATHTGGWKVDDTLADELAHLARLHIDIRCNIKGHVSFLLLLLFFAF